MPLKNKWCVVVDVDVAYEVSPNAEPKRLPHGFWKGETIKYIRPCPENMGAYVFFQKATARALKLHASVS